MSLNNSRAGRLSTLPTFTIWHEMTPLANEYKAVNLGQGFPSFPPPPFLLQEIQRILEESALTPITHQYARAQGNLELVNEIKKLYKESLSYPNLSENNILITNGTTQGINVSFQALINPGDEVIIFEPFYDAYIPDIQMAGGVVKYIQLIPSDKKIADEWKFNENQLINAITSKTKIILVNTPQNVPGKAWSLEELNLISKLAKEHNLIIISDEVYMNLVYGCSHISLASLPDMWERTITLCSIGKTFSCTGWKIGWAVGPSELISALSQVTSYQTFSVATPLQIAVARALKIASNNDYYTNLNNGYEKRRAILCEILLKNGLPPVIPSGGFFVLADISNVDPKHYYNPNETEFGRDWQFCRWLTKIIGVCAIPTTAFCANESRHLYERYARFAFCKTEEDIKQAGLRLEKLKNYFTNTTNKEETR